MKTGCEKLLFLVVLGAEMCSTNMIYAGIGKVVDDVVFYGDLWSLGVDRRVLGGF